MRIRPEYPRFESLQTSHRDVLAPYLELARRPICDLSMANLCLWQDCERATYTFIDDHLCLLIEPHDKPAYFLEPLGRGSTLTAASLCLRHAGRISHASEALVAEMPPELSHATPLRDHFDYLYEVAALAELRGTKHDGKRNQIRKFSRNNPGFQLVPLAERHREQALQVFEYWSQQRNGDGADGDGSAAAKATLCQRQALRRAFADFEPLGLCGLAVLAQDRLLGFLLGSALNAETAVVHFLYGDNSRRGIYQLLLQESCRTIFAAYDLVNLEEDLGIPSLRRTKISYDPLRLEKKFLLTPQPPDDLSGEPRA